MLVFDRENDAHLRAHYPEHAACIHFLGALDEQAPLEIEDPFGQDQAVFTHTYARISAALERAQHLAASASAR